MKCNFLPKILLILLVSCSLLKPLMAQPSWQWGLRGNANLESNVNDYDNVIDMATDPNGNVYLLTRVYFEGDCNGVPVQGFPNILNIISSIVVTSYTCEGTYRWHKVIGGTAGNNRGAALGTDTLGGVYITGNVMAYAFHPDQVNFPDSLHIDSDTVTTSTNKSLILIKYDTTGTFQWFRMPQPDSVSYITSISHTGSLDMDISPGGDAYIYSILAPGLYADGAFSITSKSLNIIKYNKEGDFKKLVPLAITVTDVSGFQGEFYNPSLANFKRDHRNGRFYLAGAYDSTFGRMKFGMTDISPTASLKMYLGSFDSLGNSVWVKQSIPNPANGSTYARIDGRPAIDEESNVYIGGLITGGETWNGYTFLNPFDQFVRPCPFVAKMDQNGNNIWASNAITDATNYGFVAVSHGVVALTGSYSNMTWGGFHLEQSLVPPGEGLDIYLARFNAVTGTIFGLDTISSSYNSSDYPSCMTTDKKGNFFIGGQFPYKLMIPGDTLTTMGGADDWFVAKFGTSVCNCTLAEPGFTTAAGSGLNTVNFTYSGTTPVDSIVWNFGDGATTTGSTVTHNFAQSGTNTVCIYVYNACGLSIYCKQVNTDGSVGMEIRSSKERIRIYPNPAANTLNISGAEGGEQIEIYNVIGQRLLKAKFSGSNDMVPIGHFAPGVYLLHVKGAKKEDRVIKFIKE